MSKGFGKVQRKIIEYLKNNEETDISSMIREIKYNSQSIWRAIRKLEKLGIVETKKHKFTGINCNWAYRPFKEYQIYDNNEGFQTKKYRPRGGQSSYKIIRLVQRKNSLN